MVTMKDIAREAGVSHGTVSNVLNKTGKVSVEKIQRVEAAIARLGYIPNVQAQKLRTGGSSTIALILPSLGEETYLDLFTAISSAAQKQGYDTVVYTTDGIPCHESDILQQLYAQHIAALVTVSTLDGTCLQGYDSLPCPVIFAECSSSQQKKANYAFLFDREQIARDLAQQITQREWHHIAFFHSSSGAISLADISAAMHRDFPQYHAEIEEFASDLNLTFNTAFDIVQCPQPFDGIITSSPMRGEAVANAIQFSNLSKAPGLLTLGSYRLYHANQIETYELDYSQMGVLLAEFIDSLGDKSKKHPRKNVLPGKGIRFQFPALEHQDSQEISMLTIDNPSTNALRKLLPMFRKLSGIKVNLTCLPYEDLHSQITVLSPTYSYDLVRMDVACFESLGDIYRPLQEVGLSTQTLSQQFVRNADHFFPRQQGQLCALPFDPSVQILLYRSDLFDNAKISRSYYEHYHEQLSVPKTIEQFQRVTAFFTRSQNPDSPTRYGTTTTNLRVSSAASDFLPFYLEKQQNYVVKDGHFHINTPEMVQSMEEYLALSRNSCQQSWWSESVRQFSSGEAATAIVYSNYVSTIVNTNQFALSGRFQAAVVPGGHPLLGGGILGVSKYSQKLAACRSFLQWFYTPDVAAMMVRLGGTSPLVDSYQDFRNISMYPWLPMFHESFLLGSRGLQLSAPGHFAIQDFEFAIGTAITNLVGGTSTPAEAAAFAQTLYDSLKKPSRNESIFFKSFCPTERKCST